MKWISVPPFGPCDSGRTLLFYASVSGGIDDGFQSPASCDTEIVPVVASGGASYSSDLFIAAMVDHLCSMYFPNSAKKDRLFHGKFLQIYQGCYRSHF